MIAVFLIITLLAPPLTISSLAAENSGTWRGKWWNYYDRGLEYSDKGEWAKALNDFTSAIDLRDKDQRRARTYGMHFTDYFPHRELGIVYFQLGDLTKALKELEISSRSAETAKANTYLDRVRKALLSGVSDKRILPPLIALSNPINGSMVKDRSIRLAGKAVGEGFISAISVNGDPYPVEKGEKEISFSREIQLEDGSNTIRVLAVDLLGNKSEVTVTAIAKRDGPGITLSEVAPVEQGGKHFVRVTGEIDDTVGIRRVLVGPREVAPKDAKNYHLDLSVERKGDNAAYVVRAFDTLGNETVAPIDLTQIIRAEKDAAETASRQQAEQERAAREKAAQERALSEQAAKAAAAEQAAQAVQAALAAQAAQAAEQAAQAAAKAAHAAQAAQAAEQAAQAAQQRELERLATLQQESERQAQLKAEAEKIAREKAEADRLAREAAEQERLAREKDEQQKLATERAEAERLARENAENERLAVIRAERDKMAREAAEKLRLDNEQREMKRLARERAEQERLARENAEQARKAVEQAEQERLAQERSILEKQAKERVLAEQAALAKVRQERLAREEAECARIAKEKSEQERLAQERAILEKQANERVLAEQAAMVKAEKERVAREAAERTRIANEKAAQERLALEKAVAEKGARERAEQLLLAQQKAEQERIVRQKAEAERLAQERLAQEQMAGEKAELEKRQREQVAAIQVERQKLKEILDEQKLNKALGTASDKQLELGMIASGDGTKPYQPALPSPAPSSASAVSSDSGCGFFTLDHESPIISIKGLDAIPQVFVDAFPLDGEISDNCRVDRLKINGRDIAIKKGKKIYFSKVIRIESGENLIKIEAYDGAGNRAEGTVIVTRKLPSVMQNGSRMSLVVLPFDFNRAAGDVTSLASDYLTGAFSEQKRFLVAERQKLKNVLEEQKFTQAVLDDTERAAKLGRIMAAEAIVATTVRETEHSLEVTARVINTETSEVMDVLDAYTEDKSVPSVKELMIGLAAKIARVFPVTEGLVISRDDDQVMTDLGSASHVRQRHGAIFYRKGKEIIHPASGKSLGWDSIKLGEGYIEEVQEGFSKVRLADRYRDGKINPSDLVVTK